jgi:preprotein translocase subunit SecG
MTTVLLIIHLFVTLALIGVVLIQRSEGGGLGVGSTQGMGSFMSGRGTANLLTRMTAVLATLFMILSLGLALLNRGTTVNGHHSILDLPPTPAIPAAPVPAPVAPPAASTAPATPPAAPSPAPATDSAPATAPVTPSATTNPAPATDSSPATAPATPPAAPSPAPAADSVPTAPPAAAQIPAPNTAETPAPATPAEPAPAEKP